MKADSTLRNVCRPSDSIDDLNISSNCSCSCVPDYSGLVAQSCTCTARYLWLLNPHVYAASRCFLHCDGITHHCKSGCRTCNGDCSILPQHECPICMVSVFGHLCSICKAVWRPSALSSAVIVIKHQWCTLRGHLVISQYPCRTWSMRL